MVAYEGYPVPVLVGSSVKTDRPTRCGVKLPRGAQVRGIGRTMTDDEGTWLPIEPPDGEVRYVRTEDVAKPGPPVRTAAASPPARPASTIPPPPPDGDALWRDAEKAERTGRLADAIRLYQLAGDANLAVNRARADEAYRRAHWLQQANTTTNAPGGSYYYPDRNAQATPPAANPVRLIGPSSPGAPAAQLVSTQTASSPWGTSSTAGYGPPVTGRLNRPYRTLENQWVYLLMKEDGSPITYVIAQPGVDLSGYINRRIELCGPVTYRSDLRGNLLRAAQVREVP